MTKIPTILTSNRIAWLLCSIPLWLILAHVFSPDFWKTSLVYGGYSAAGLLAICLASSPLARTFPNTEWLKFFNRHKKRTGLAAFYYALIHVCSILVVKNYTWRYFFHPVLIFGEIALFILFLLALTSNKFSKTRMGWDHWKSLHRKVYLAEGCVFVHMALQGGTVLNWGLALFIPLFIVQRLRIRK